MSNKLALCMIGMDRQDQIIRALNSTEGVFDVYCLQDTGSKDKTVEVFVEWCKEHKKPYKTSRKYLGKEYEYVTVNGKKILGNFGRARNDSFALAKKAGANYAFWFDTDDVLVNPQLLTPLVEKMHRDRIHATILTYVYAKGEGNIKPVVQERERLIDLSVPGRWINRVHETYEFLQPTKIIRNKEVYIEHRRSGKEVLETGRRNNLIMKAQEKDEGIDSFSIGMLNNLAYDHWEHREYEESLKYYKILLKRNPPPSELLFYVYIKIARAYMQLADNNNAVKYANEALKLNKSISDPYLVLAEAYTNIGDAQEAIHFADKVIAMGIPETTSPVNEFEYIVVPRRIKINALLNTGEIKKALEVINELLQLSGDEEVRREKSMIEKDLVRQNAIAGIVNVMRYLQNMNQMKFANRVKEAIPIDLLDDPNIRNAIKEIDSDYRKKVQRVKMKGNKSIVVYAGQGVIEPWDGDTDITRGIGGSEGMMIQLTRELAKLGNKVVVYNNCGASSGKVFNGVLYEHFDTWNSEIKSDVFISLRRPDIFQHLIKSTKQYLWLHDTHYGDIPTSMFYAPNKIIVLSQAHKAVIKQAHGIEDDSIFWMSRNALNPIAMDYARKNAGERNPYQLIYASSYDRGLNNVLEMWPRIKKAIPQATLKIFYGWNTYDKLMEARRSEEMARYKSQMVEMIAQSDGVQELGRATQTELYKEFAESSIWFYPTEFYEISCITAMTAQALGCVPVCTPFAALNETVSTKYGMKIELPKIAEGLIYLLQNQEELNSKRKPITKWAERQFGMVELAKSWDKEFNG